MAKQVDSNSNNFEWLKDLNKVFGDVVDRFTTVTDDEQREYNKQAKILITEMNKINQITIDNKQDLENYMKNKYNFDKNMTEIYEKNHIADKKNLTDETIETNEKAQIAYHSKPLISPKLELQIYREDKLSTMKKEIKAFNEKVEDLYERMEEATKNFTKHGKKSGTKIGLDNNSQTLKQFEEEIRELNLEAQSINLKYGKDINLSSDKLGTINQVYVAGVDSHHWCGVGTMTNLSFSMNQKLQKEAGFGIGMYEANDLKSGTNSKVRKHLGDAYQIGDRLEKGDLGYQKISDNNNGRPKDIQIGDVFVFHDKDLETKNFQKGTHPGHIFTCIGFDKKGNPKFASDFMQNSENPYPKVNFSKFWQHTRQYRSDTNIAKGLGIEVEDFAELQARTFGGQDTQRLLAELANNPKELYEKAGLPMPDGLEEKINEINKNEKLKKETFGERINEFKPNLKTMSQDIDEANEARNEKIKELVEKEKELSKIDDMSIDELKGKIAKEGTKEKDKTEVERKAETVLNERLLEKGGFKEASKNLMDEAKAQKDSAKAEQELAKQEKARAKELKAELKAELKDVKKGKADGINFAEWNEKLQGKKEATTPAFSDIVAQKADSKQSFNFSSLFVKDSSNNAMRDESYKPSESVFLASYNNELKSLQGGDTMSSVDTMKNDTPSNVVKHRA